MKNGPETGKERMGWIVQYFQEPPGEHRNDIGCTRSHPDGCHRIRQHVMLRPATLLLLMGLVHLTQDEARAGTRLRIALRQLHPLLVLVPPPPYSNWQ